MPPPTDQARWFTEEVDPHRSASRAYVQRAFPGVRDVDDVVQDSLLRIWTARASRQIGCARALFTIVCPEARGGPEEEYPIVVIEQSRPRRSPTKTPSQPLTHPHRS